ncbi:Ig-like domain-containing protein [Thalassotalea montiporae]
MELFRRLSFAMALMTLVGCGGGDGGLSSEGNPDPDNGGGNQTTPIVISLALDNDIVSAAAPIELTATVTQDNQPVPNKLVSFIVSEATLASFNPENGAASTNAEGIATIQVVVGTLAGAGTITASVLNDDDSQSTADIVFTSQGDSIGNEGPEVTSLTLFADSPQIASSGAGEVQLTALVKDSRNNLVEGATVSFEVSSGELEVEKAETETDGLASAKLTTRNPENRLVTITASSGNITDSVLVQVVGTAIQLNGSSALAINDSTDYVLNLRDSDGNGIANQVVDLSVANGSSAQIDIPSMVTTDFTGQAIFTATGLSGGTNSIVAAALGTTESLQVSVQSDSFLFTAFDNNNGLVVNPSNSLAPDVGLSKSADITLTWLDNGTPVADGTRVDFTSTRGTLSALSGTTVNGQVSVSVQADNAGPAVVTFTGGSGDTALSNQISFEFVAETVETVVAQASPASVEPNGETSVISVTLRDPNDNLVKGKLVDFTLDDTNGGSIFPASAITDSNGSASTVYTSNAVSSQEGVSVTATVRDQQDKSDTVNLTVAGRELFLTLGTGNNIEELDITTYNKQYTVFATDADSTPVDNVTLTVTAIPVRYYKGYWAQLFDESGSFVSWVTTGRQPTEDDPTLTSPISCINEDLNLNGILDPGEDTNGDGILTPGNIAAATGQVTTDDQGRALIDVLYPQTYGSWVDIELAVTTRVTGTESREFTIYTLPTSAEDLTEEDVVPPTQNVGLKGPFGGVQSCFTDQ